MSSSDSWWIGLTHQQRRLRGSRWHVELIRPGRTTFRLGTFKRREDALSFVRRVAAFRADPRAAATPASPEPVKLPLARVEALREILEIDPDNEPDDIDLAALAAEKGVTPDELLRRIVEDDPNADE